MYTCSCSLAPEGCVTCDVPKGAKAATAKPATGWVCPICGAVYAFWVAECRYCVEAARARMLTTATTANITAGG